MRKTKIICTIGPACSNEGVLTDMCKAGMNVARLNFSHGDHEEHLRNIKLVTQVREKLDLPIAIMLDTKGPEYRIKTFAEHKVELKKGDDFIFTVDDIEGDKSRVSVNYKELIHEVKPGEKILVNNGLLEFEVRRIAGNDVICEVINGGMISDRKSMNFPNHVLKGEYLSDQDKEDLLFGIKNDVDFVAASFVSTRQDVRDLRDFLDENGGEDIEIIAKIENRSGVDNLEKICEIANGVMVARGDLGVEIPFVEVPAIQKMIIRKCRVLGKRVIIATEMLESMISNPRPTRAEISDVANAVYDGASAIMLSGESAAGKYPIDSVKNMAEIAEYTEGNIDYSRKFMITDYKIKNNLDAVSHSACSMAIATKARCIIISSMSGKTARMVSRFRPPIDIIGITTSEKIWRKLNLSWGVVPAMSEEYDSEDVLINNAIKKAKNVIRLEKGENVILTLGATKGKPGSTNTIRLESI